MPRLRAVAMLLLATFLLVAVAPGQPRRAPAPDGSDNDIHLIQTSLRELIEQAYHLAPQQVAGPDWLDVIAVDLVDHVPPGTTADQVPHLLRIILAQRFKLVFHRQMRVMNVFLLEVGKGGPRLDPTPAWDKRGPECENRPSGPPLCRAQSMPELAWRLQNEWPGVAPIFDRTGLAGTYDFNLQSLHYFDLGVHRDSPIEFKVQSMRDQLKSLGLTIEQRKEPADVLVVDHCEKKPTGN